MNLAIAAPSNRLLPAIWKLIWLRLRITANSFKHAKTGRKILTIVAYLGLLIFAGGIFFVSWLLLGFLRSPTLAQIMPIDPAVFLQTVPVVIMAGLFVGILFSSFGVLLQALYLAGDMDFLLTSPVPIRAVFSAKLLQAVLPNFGLISLFGLPVLFGLGISGHYNLLYYPLVLMIMIALTLAAAGLASLLVMLVTRIFPARRVAEVLGFLTATLTILCSQTGNLTQSFEHSVNVSEGQVGTLMAQLTRFNNPWLPLAWAGRGLVDLGEGRWLSGLLLVGLTLGLCAVAFSFALATAERWYYTGWAGMQIVARRKKAARAARAALEVEARPTTLLERLLPAPVRGIISKDFLVLRRDLRNMSQLITPFIFGVIYAVMLLRGDGPSAGQGEAPAFFMNSLRALFSFGNVAIALFVGWTLLGRLGGMAFSAEGRNFWILKSSPIRPGYLLLAKYLVAYLPALVLGWIFLAGITIVQGFTLSTFLYNLLIVTMCLAGMNGVLLGFGVIGANFNWEDPRRMNAGTMGCLGQLITFLFLPIAFGFFVGPIWLAAAVGLPQIIGYLVGAILGVIISVLAAFLPPFLVRARVSHLAEG